MSNSKEKEWLFSFGCLHPLYHDKYIKIKGTFESARGEMIRRFGDNWIHQYKEKEEDYLKSHGITEIKIPNIITCFYCGHDYNADSEDNCPICTTPSYISIELLKK